MLSVLVVIAVVVVQLLLLLLKAATTCCWWWYRWSLITVGLSSLVEHLPAYLRQRGALVDLAEPVLHSPGVSEGDGGALQPTERQRHVSAT
jgi:hypothetical protein